MSQFSTQSAFQVTCGYANLYTGNLHTSQFMDSHMLLLTVAECCVAYISKHVIKTDKMMQTSKPAQNGSH